MVSDEIKLINRSRHNAWYATEADINRKLPCEAYNAGFNAIIKRLVSGYGILP